MLCIIYELDFDSLRFKSLYKGLLLTYCYYLSFLKIMYFDLFERYQNGSNYFILLILTDGVITDMYDTIDTIVNSSCLPLSIIIVGIGNADFSAMEELDSDNKMLTSPSGKKATRDIVQFVPFNQFLTSGLNPSVARLHLAREVLREIPDQFIGFMKSRNITPQPPRYGLDSLPPDPEMS